ncbi:MAG: HlyD family efflux transporter periplasmic adaptor subunit [Clostridiales bacterium]|nr:HlyD family efflux transporter periplasmic adaptor subunit [Clostridiales bacterium]
MKNRRKTIIRIMVAFVACLALLTFFSNTIMNLTIPKVMGEYATRGNLAYTNTATGTIKVENETKVTSVEGRTIDKVMVSSYDTVSEGDVIATLKPVENSDDLKELESQLLTLQREKEYAERAPSTSDLTVYETAVDTAQDTLEAAQEGLTAAQNKQATIDAADATILDQTAQLAEYQSALDYATAEKAGYEDQIKTIDDSIKPLEDQITVYISYGYSISIEEDTGYYRFTASDGKTESDPVGYTPVSDEEKIRDLCYQINQYIDAKAPLQEGLDAANAVISEKSSAIAACELAVTNAETAKELAEALPSVSDAQKAVDTAQTGLASAQKSLSDAQINAGIDADKAQDAADDRDKSIEELETKIADLEAKIAQTEIKAPADGYVYNITIEEGSVMDKNQTIAYIIPVDDRQCTATFTFPSDVAARLSIGDEMDVTMGYVDSCTIINIKPDPDNPREYKQVKCSINDMYAFPGESITVRADKSNKDYDCVIPSSAVNKDNSGYFVYQIIGSSSPLGDKYTVKRVDVTVQDDDGTYAAISGDKLDKDAMIVVRSEKPLEDGERVRLEDFDADKKKKS